MNKGRLEAFSDGVIAIIIPIMVLEMKVPQDGNPQALVPSCRSFSATSSASSTLESTGTTAKMPRVVSGALFINVCASHYS
jgi:hypothetical protein